MKRLRPTPELLTQSVHRYVKQAELGKSGSCHLFRHAMAALMLEGGADLRSIQEMLGHASLESTEIYTKISVRWLQEVYEATHPAAKIPALVAEDGAGATLDEHPARRGGGGAGPDGGQHDPANGPPELQEGARAVHGAADAPPQANAALAAWCGAGTTLGGSHPPPLLCGRARGTFPRARSVTSAPTFCDQPRRATTGETR